MSATQPRAARMKVDRAVAPLTSGRGQAAGGSAAADAA